MLSSSYSFGVFKIIMLKWPFLLPCTFGKRLVTRNVSLSFMLVGAVFRQNWKLVLICNGLRTSSRFNRLHLQESTTASWRNPKRSSSFVLRPPPRCTFLIFYFRTSASTGWFALLWCVGTRFSWVENLSVVNLTGYGGALPPRPLRRIN